MKQFAVLFFSFFLSAGVWAQGTQPNTELPQDYPELRFSMNPLYHSVGVRLGLMKNVRRERVFPRTFEGDLMMGFGTNPGVMVDRQCERERTRARRNDDSEDCSLFTNPFEYSFLSRSLFDHAADVDRKGKPAIIYYINYYVHPSHLLMKTSNMLLNVFSVQPNLQIEPSHQISAWKVVHPEAGVITGRIVQASLEYPIRKTFEVVIQEQENTDSFRAMSVNSGEMFRYITRAMLTGRKLRIEYIRLHGPHGGILSTLLNYMTNYRIISVEILPD